MANRQIYQLTSSIPALTDVFPFQNAAGAGEALRTTFQNVANVLSGSFTQLGINVSPQYNLDVSGSARITDVLILPFQNPLPSGKPTGSIALSGSGGTFVGMFVYNGSSWTSV